MDKCDHIIWAHKRRMYEKGGLIRDIKELIIFKRLDQHGVLDMSFKSQRDKTIQLRQQTIS